MKQVAIAFSIARLWVPSYRQISQIIPLWCTLIVLLCAIIIAKDHPYRKLQALKVVKVEGYKSLFCQTGLRICQCITYMLLRVQS